VEVTPLVLREFTMGKRWVITCTTKS
jgi:hypothetical protein